MCNILTLDQSISSLILIKWEIPSVFIVFEFSNFLSFGLVVKLVNVIGKNLQNA